MNRSRTEELTWKSVANHLISSVYNSNWLLSFKVHHINANFFLDQTAMKPEEEGATFSFSAGFEDPSTSTYISFLKEGLEKAKEYQAQ